MMLETVILVLGLTALAVVWDVARRHYDTKRRLAAVLDMMQKHERELERLNAQLQGVLGKLNATTAAAAQRMPRMVR